MTELDATQARLMYVTTSNAQEAETLATKLVEERLVACANIIDGMRSFFWWEGVVQNETETVLIVKTQQSRVEAVTQRIKALHSYDCPCVVVLNIEGGNIAFLDWIVTETSGSPKPPDP